MTFRDGCLLVTLLLLTVAVRLLVGSSSVGAASLEVLAIRADRLFVGLIVGAALAVAGVALQALLRNALAEPFILGLSTGAAAGMVVQWWVAAALGWALSAGYLGAAGGAGVSMAVVYFASRRRGVIDPLGMLLVGVVWSTICGAGIMLAVHLQPTVLRANLSEWMMGFLDVGGGSVGSWWLGAADPPWPALGVLTLTVTALLSLSVMAPGLDAATLSEAEAESLGLRLKRLRTWLFVSATLLAGGAVVLAGPVAFVGLICPHLARLWVGPSHRPLLWTSAGLGASLVVLADTCGALMDWSLHTGVIPLGIFTAMIGGVGFLWMLRPHLGRSLG